MYNDVYSLEKEEARGDMDNLVLVIEHEENLDHHAVRPGPRLFRELDQPRGTR
jgi:hypothetical protein